MTKTDTQKTNEPNETKQPALLAVYLFLGDDELKRKTILERLFKRVADEGDISFNSQRFDAIDLKDDGEVMDSCYTLPFASNKRLVIIDNVDKANKQVSEAVIEYLKKPAETTVLVLIAQKLLKTSRLFKSIESYNPKAIISTEVKKSWEMPECIRDLAKDHGLQLDLNAAKCLIDRVGKSTISLNKEIERLTSYTYASGRKSLTSKEINLLVTKTAETSAWDFADALFARDAARALLLRKQLESEDATSLLRVCVMRLRELITARAYMDRGIIGSAAIAVSMKRPEWQIKRVVEMASRFKAIDLRRLLVRAANSSKEMMSGADKEIELTRFVLSVVR
ncbi:MAG: DNA polymerase III subunit delta [Coriobacteriales bacterium]|jgi:DNA polymerase-3 subunit delta|nr:DNA polymerase III subunit delta [Coriobacteriales bacterium]